MAKTSIHNNFSVLLCKPKCRFMSPVFIYCDKKTIPLSLGELSVFLFKKILSYLFT